MPHTIAELDSNTLTAEGTVAWADVLGAQVVRGPHRDLVKRLILAAEASRWS